MTITTEQANTAANMLSAWGAWATRDAQGIAWADYLNHEVPDADADELPAACRAAFRDWNRNGRTWQINVDHVAQAILRDRRDRVDAHINAHGRPDPDGVTDPRLAQKGRRAWRRSVERGATPDRAVEKAWAAIGQAPPPRMLESGRGRATARSVIEALTRRSNRRAL